MTTIVENTDSGSSAVGLILGILLAVALVIGGMYFYNSGGMSHTETNNTTTVLPSAPSAPTTTDVTVSQPAPSPPATAPAQ
jgi:hypothetical protein